MRIINVRNVCQGLVQGIAHLHAFGEKRDSRNGVVIQAEGPVATIYSHPKERVLFFPWRDANPFFHFFESLWMLAGRNDVASLTPFVKRMASFSDNGETFNAAYGYRWRHARDSDVATAKAPFRRIYERDQLKVIIEGLRKNRDCRRQVLQIWDHAMDLGMPTKDAACNVAATFQIDSRGCLDMVVFCRSNDIIWGCYGANAVHFSFLLEYIARSVGVSTGTYTQISVNYHAYFEVFHDTVAKMTESGTMPYGTYPYEDREVEVFPLMSTAPESWNLDLAKFMAGPTILDNSVDPFFRDVAVPIYRAHVAYRDKNFNQAYNELDQCLASDWRLACREWLQRREVTK